MGCVLLSLHDEAVADFLTDDLDVDDVIDLINIVKRPIIAEPQFPGGNRVRSHPLDPSGLLRRLMGEMSLDAVKDEPSLIGRD
jgi:hypothetical protein